MNAGVADATCEEMKHLNSNGVCKHLSIDTEYQQPLIVMGIFVDLVISALITLIL